MLANSDLVLFAIKAGVRLYAAGRKAYAEATLKRPLILPLPRGEGIGPESASMFFSEDSQGNAISACDENQRIRTLLSRVDNGEITKEEESELTQIYFTYLRELHPDMFNDPVLTDEPKGHELVAVMTIRQWTKGELGDKPSALQRIAGTLVNIAVDYFAHTPGAISTNRPAGRALKAFLEAIDDLDFAQAPPSDIAGDLLIAIVDSVGSNPDLIGNTETEKKLIQNISIALSASAKKHLADVPTAVRWNGSAWLQIVARAFVKGGFDTVLADPNTILGVNDDQGKFIKEVGGTIADLLIGPDRLRFQALFSGDGINTVVKAALSAAAKNPAILKIDNQGIRNIIVGVAEGLSQQSNLFTRDIFPELTRLVLIKTADNLELVWPEGAGDPGKHLLITGTRQLFSALAQGTHQDNWPTLTKHQIMAIAETVFDELVENPDWLLNSADLENNTPLDVAVKAALESLKKYKGPRLSSDAAVTAIKAAVNASAQQLSLLKKLPKGGSDAGKIAITAIIDALFETAFGNDLTAEEKWVRARKSTLTTILEISFEQLAKTGAEQKHIDVLRREIGGLIDQRLSIEDLGDRLEVLLKAA